MNLSAILVNLAISVRATERINVLLATSTHFRRYLVRRSATRVRQGKARKKEHPLVPVAGFGMLYVFSLLADFPI